MKSPTFAPLSLGLCAASVKPCAHPSLQLMSRHLSAWMHRFVASRCPPWLASWPSTTFAPRALVPVLVGQFLDSCPGLWHLKHNLSAFSTLGFGQFCVSWPFCPQLMQLLPEGPVGRVSCRLLCGPVGGVVWRGAPPPLLL